MKRTIFPVILAFLLLITTSCKNTSLEKGEPADPQNYDLSDWEDVKEGLNISFASTNLAYSKSLPPQEGLVQNIRIRAWKGDKAHAKLLFWSGDNTGDISLKTYPETPVEGISAVQHRIVKYVLADSFINGCGRRDKDTITSNISPDILSETSSFILESRACRPVWLSLETAEDCKPGTYKYLTEVRTNLDTITLSFEVEVIDRVLPPPGEWSFHLDLWQNPFAVARYHNVQLWSQEHWDLLVPLLEKLASAGQKCITTTLNDKPWGGQTYDPFGSMITWIKDDQGQWSYDYSIFDQYVNFAMDCGISKQINCYSMVPWNNRFVYYNEGTTAYEEVEAIPGSNQYNELWTPFLVDFREHLRDMGWLDITSIAMDERKEEDMKKIIDLVKTNVPELKISLAGNILQPEIDKDLYDLSIAIGLDPDRKSVEERVAGGKPTTFYTCCARPEHPNNFTFSPPADNTYIGWFAAGYGYSGFLRWAYNSWVEDPLYDSRFRTWPSGDTYLIYPGALSSVRFEKLVEGIRDYEKIRILREDLANDPSEEAIKLEKELDEFLGSIHYSELKEKPSSDVVLKGQDLLYRIATR